MSRKSRRKHKGKATTPPTPPAPPKDTTPAGGDDPLTERERRFVEEYISDPNATQAYRRAFKTKSYVTAKTEGCRLLTNPNIATEIEAGRRMQAKRIRMSADHTLREVARIAFADASDLFDDEEKLLPIRKVPIHTRRAIQSVKVKRQKVYGDRSQPPVGEEDIIEIKLASKDAALGRLMKHQGLVKELPPLEVLLGLFPEQVRERIRQMLAETVGRDGGLASPGQVTDSDPSA
jgi:phage terminase small subunit